MEFWTERKKGLEEALLVLEVEAALEEANAWIRDTGEVYLRQRDEPIHAQEKEALLREHNHFKAAAKVMQRNLLTS